MSHPIPTSAALPLPADLAAPFAAAHLHLRPFGAALEDLAFDLGAPGAAGPEALTAVLAATARQAGEPVPPALLWALPVGLRIEALLALVELSGVRELTARLRCEGCEEAIEIDLAPGELTAHARAAAANPLELEIEGQTRELRRPTGDDQLAWRVARFADEAEAARTVAASLLVAKRPEGKPGPEAGLAEGANRSGDSPDASGRDGVASAAPENLSDAAVATVEAALDAADPLVQFRLSAVCPFCGATSEHPLDLAALALAELRRRQAELIETVHRLALAYHWTEAEVLALPLWRRARYLALAEREEARR